MSGYYLRPINENFLSLTGGTVSGDTIFLNNLSATTFFSAGTLLEEIIYNIANNIDRGTGSTFSKLYNFTENIPITVNHNLNTQAVLVQIVDTNTNELIYGEVNNYQSHSVSVTLSQTLNNIRVTVAGGLFVQVPVDTYVTGFTYNNQNKLTINRNHSEPDLSVTINQMTGLTISGGLSANTIYVENKIEPTVDNIVDLGSSIKRFRNLNTINGVATNFTASTRMTTSEIMLGATVMTENNIILSGYTIDGGAW